MIRSIDLIAIFDVSIEKNSELSHQYIDYARQNNMLEIIDATEVKSIVLTKDQLYYSPISSSTLKRRLHQIV